VASFQQAVIKVEKESEFEELKGAIVRAFAPDKVETFLRQLKKQSLRVRDWDSVLTKGMLEKVDESSGGTARELYEQLAVSDRAQIREFYLLKIEEVSPELRAKFHTLFQYY
jgi:hypothetical protein